jgi:hypothetical protein
MLPKPASVLLVRRGRILESAIRSNAGHRRIPFAHHREQDGGSEEREGEAIVSHHLHYPLGL